MDYAQCDNGPPGSAATTHCLQSQWINGILNSNNSHYQEDDVTPQRLTVTFPDGTSGDHVHTITLRYLDRKAGVHAYDYLAAANTTMSNAIDDRCNGIPASYCPDGTQAGGAPSQASVLPAYQADAQTVFPDPGKTTGLTKDHMSNLSADHLKLSIFGATFTTGSQATVTDAANPGSNPPAISTPTHDNACTGCGDDYSRIVLSFTTTGTGPHNVQLLFGGHLAAGFNADGWGENLGAGGISGGPYHIKWDAADGVSVGNRDNQIQSSAIAQIVAQGTGLSTTPSPTSPVAIGADLSAVSDSATLTVADAAHAPTGSVVFDLYGPFTNQPLSTDSPKQCVDPATGVTGNRLHQFTDTTLTVDSVDTTKYTASSDSFNLGAASGFGVGWYQWVAHYVPGTDQYNLAADGGCFTTSEQLHVTKAAAAATSTQTVSDTVTVTGNTAGGTPDGTVSWYLYPSSTDCTDGTNATGSDVVGDGSGDTNNTLSSGSATSSGITLSTTTSHTYYWKVVYNGGTNYSSSTVEGCGTQTVTIDN